MTSPYRPDIVSCFGLLNGEAVEGPLVIASEIDLRISDPNLGVFRIGVGVLTELNQ